MVQFECPRALHPLLSFTSGVHYGVPILLHAGKENACGTGERAEKEGGSAAAAEESDKRGEPAIPQTMPKDPLGAPGSHGPADIAQRPAIVLVKNA